MSHPRQNVVISISLQIVYRESGARGNDFKLSTGY
jgi:hypothetical protein